MNAVECKTMMTQGGQIVLPAQFLEDIPTGQQLKVVVMWEAGSVASAWLASRRLRFEEASCNEDAVYEQLANETPGP